MSRFIGSLLSGAGQGMIDVGKQKMETQARKEELEAQKIHAEGLERLRASNNMAQTEREATLTREATKEEIAARGTQQRELTTLESTLRRQDDTAQEQMRGDQRIRELQFAIDNPGANPDNQLKTDAEGYTYEKIPVTNEYGTATSTVMVRTRGGVTEKLDMERGWVPTAGAKAPAPAPAPQESGGLLSKAVRTGKSILGLSDSSTASEPAPVGGSLSRDPNTGAVVGSTPDEPAEDPSQIEIPATTLTGPDADAYVKRVARAAKMTEEQARQLLTSQGVVR